jgi:uncharacterized protein (TIGR03437 family)
MAAFGQDNNFKILPDALLMGTIVDSDAIAINDAIAVADIPTQFQVKARTASGGNWLSIDQAAGTTPAVITVRANRSGLPVGEYIGSLDFVPPSGKTLTMPVILDVCQVAQHPLDPCIPDQATPAAALKITPNSLSITVVRGSNPVVTPILVEGPAPQTIVLHLSTKDNGNWLSVDKTSFQTIGLVAVTAAGQNLPVGDYEGEIDADTPNRPTAKVPVLMHVVDTAVPVTSINPSFVPAPSPDTTFTITGSGFKAGAQVRLTVSTPSVPGVDMMLPNPATLIDSNTLRVVIPGTFLQQSEILAVRVVNPGSGTSDPLMLTVGHPAPEVRSNGVSNSASVQGDHVAPGELITIFGAAMGPASPATGAVGQDGALPRQVAGVRVLFDGQPAGLLYVSDTQINAVVPNSISGKTETQANVEYNGSSSPVVHMPVAAAAPGIFTAAGDGKGGLLEITANPGVGNPGPGVGRGDIMTFYATGAGLVQNPAGDGMIAIGANKTLLPVSVQIGGQDADVLYAGTSPGQLEGMLQVTVRVPATVQPGNTVPVDLNVGGFHSQTGATLIVK